ncbi:hypothetical protein BJV82DRAFT_637501 [Fennellomyces sp. T-0311]|nr:hypothetical protein BJV82DRAFT_637501 [Fennellomyces sp. T-0311]
MYKIKKVIRNAYEPDQNVWKDSTKIMGPVFKELILSYSEDFRSKQWIGDCPALEKLTLRNMEVRDGLLLYAIKRLPRLRCLEFQSQAFLDSFSRFETLFHLLAFKGDKAQLDTVILNDFTVNDSESYLVSIAGFKRLRSLTIIKGNCASGNAITQFTEKLKEVDSLLEELTITGVENVVDDTLFSIVDNIPRLQRLTLNNLDGITDYGIRMIVAGRKEMKLSALNIHHCSKVTKEGMYYTT